MAESTSRPRRSTRAPDRFVASKAPTQTSSARTGTKRERASTSTIGARTSKVKSPEGHLRFLLQDPKSPLVRVDMSDVVNAGTWAALPASSRARLANLLPPTAFADYVSTVEPSHPSQRWKNEETAAGPSTAQGHAMQIRRPSDDQELSTFPSSPPRTPQLPPSSPLTAPPASSSPVRRSSPPPMILDGPHEEGPPVREPTTSFFTEPHFLAAMRTWQDHLYTGWLTDAHLEKVRVFEEGIREGRVHVPWKDEVWEREHREEDGGGDGEGEDVDGKKAGKGKGKGRVKSNAGDAREWRLQHLTKNGVIRAGDVLSYSRHFVQLGITVEKDVLIEHIHTRTHALSILAPSYTTLFLPAYILTDPPMTPPENDTSLRESEVTSPSQLENVILDLDGRVPRAQRPHGNAWKTFSVWRRREGSMDEMDVDVEGIERGGRRRMGTLFYLRGSCFREE